MIEHSTIYLDGAWIEPSGTELLDVVNPATEEPVARIRLGGPDDVDAAVTAARSALSEWATTPPGQRARYLRALHGELVSRQDEIASLITVDVGAPARIASRIHTALPLRILAGYADLAQTHAFTERIANSTVVHEPLGVVAAITPWNYPLQQIMTKLAPALAAGNTLILKPSELAPLVAYLLFEAIDAAGLPPGVANLVVGTGPAVGAALAAHPGVDMVSFTGSTAVGTRICELAAPTVKKVALELGGKSANVVLPDADWRTAVKVGVASAFLNSGQTCTALTRLLLPEEIYEQALTYAGELAEAATVGDPADAGTRLGPLVSAHQRERVLDLVDRAVADGARLVTGGSQPPDGLTVGYYVRPTVLGDVDPNSAAAQEEIFGPVLAVFRYRDEQEALAMANNSRYGLAGAVWSADQERALRFAARMQAGSIDVNGGAYNPDAPFGGYKMSGVGRELGVAGLTEFTQTKAIQL